MRTKKIFLKKIPIGLKLSDIVVGGSAMINGRLYAVTGFGDALTEERLSPTKEE
jgi:hypothetical protein